MDEIAEAERVGVNVPLAEVAEAEVAEAQVAEVMAVEAEVAEMMSLGKNRGQQRMEISTGYQRRKGVFLSVSQKYLVERTKARSITLRTVSTLR